jgi:cellulose synthase (UDP-forming)
VLISSVAGILYALLSFNNLENRNLYAANMFWAGMNASIALLCVLWTLRKKHKRRDFRFPANFPSIVESEEGIAAVSIEDIHDKGCATVSPVRYDPGTELNVRLAFQDLSLALRGKVLYVKELEDLALFRHGIRFEGVGEADRRLIVLFNFRFFLKKYMDDHDLPSPTPFSFLFDILKRKRPKRRSRRLPLRIPVLILAGEEFVSCTTEDISDEGMKIFTYRKLPSEIVHGTLSGLEGRRTLSGRVVWSKEVNFYGIKAYRYGIRLERVPFAELKEDSSYAVT